MKSSWWLPPPMYLERVSIANGVNLLVLFRFKGAGWTKDMDELCWVFILSDATFADLVSLNSVSSSC